MAGDWIKMRTDLDDDPAVVAIASKTGLDELAVIGRLWKLWKWANTHTDNGDAPSVTETWMDRYLSAPGFSRAVAEAGWLDLTRGVKIPNFERHNGQSAKARALTNARMKRLRDGESVTDASPEKRREEKKTPKAPKGAGGFDLKAWVKTPVFRALKASNVTAIADLIKRDVTEEMVAKHRGKTGPAMYSALINDLAERDAAAEESEHISAWIAQRTPDELEAIDAEARSRLPPTSQFQTNGQIRDTRAWNDIVSERAKQNGASSAV